MKTRLQIKKDKFLINGRLTYEELPNAPSHTHGLLLNQRFIQGVFDVTDRARFARFGADYFDADRQTNELIAVLPEWYGMGLRAFTVGFQGGGPCFTVDSMEISNNPFGESGCELDPAYSERMDRILRAADENGMVVIVSLFYGAQASRIKTDEGIRRAVKNSAQWLKEGGYTNVILEIANEHTIPPFKSHPVLYDPDGIVELMKSAREVSGGLPVGCSDVGGKCSRQIVENSDVILVHGNGQSRQHLYNLIMLCREWNPDSPIVINEDSQAVSNLPVAVRCGASWGYYNNMTKQEPPTDWRITQGEDTYFAIRMARELGIETPELPEEQRYFLQGLKPLETANGKRWVRLASLYPETIDYVEFYRNRELLYTAYDDPFTVNYISNWLQAGTDNIRGEAHWEAVVHLVDGRVFTYKQTVYDAVQ